MSVEPSSFCTTPRRDYHESTRPIVELFEQKELVVKVDGTRSPEGVQAEIRRKLHKES